MRLFLEAFNEKREKSEEKYKAFKTKYQVWIKYFGRATSILAPLASIVITVCIIANISGSVKIGFSIVSISCAMIAICLTIFTTYISWKKCQLKNDQQNYEDKIKIIEEKMGISGRHKMFYNLEEYGALQRQVRENTKLTSINKKLGEEIEKLSKENARQIKENTKLVEANHKQIKENTQIVDINKEQIGKNTELTSTNKSLVTPTMD